MMNYEYFLVWDQTGGSPGLLRCFASSSGLGGQEDAPLVTGEKWDPVLLQGMLILRNTAEASHAASVSFCSARCITLNLHPGAYLGCLVCSFQEKLRDGATWALS